MPFKYAQDMTMLYQVVYSVELGHGFTIYNQDSGGRQLNTTESDVLDQRTRP